MKALRFTTHVLAVSVGLGVVILSIGYAVKLAREAEKQPQHYIIELKK